MLLAPSDHFIRYCKPSYCAEDGRILNVAFRLRDGEDSLSGDHYEYFEDEPYRQIVHALTKRCLKPSRNGKLVKVTCSDVMNTIQPICSEEVYFERDNTGSHTGLYGIRNTHTAITERLCSCIVDQVSIAEVLDDV